MKNRRVIGKWSAVGEAHDGPLQPGEGLFLFTRGITEAADGNGHTFSADRLAALLRQEQDTAPARLIRQVVRAVMRFTDGAPLTNDLTVLALRYRGR